MLRPIPPQPNTAVDAPAGTPAVRVTEPTPVMTAHPVMAATSNGTSGGIGMTASSMNTMRSDIVEAVR